MRQVYRFTYKTQCGKTDIVIETGASFAEAKRKAEKHIEDKHTPMELVKVESRPHGTYVWSKVNLYTSW